MTTIVKDSATKLSVALIALAMVFSAFASTASAQEQTAEDLQKMINDLLAQVASLQSQVGQGDSSDDMHSAGPASVCPYTWTRNLSAGDTGMDVKKLQQYLNSDPDTRVAVPGSLGSDGMETDYYGPATGAAVAKYQMKYRADILTPLGLVAATQYYGLSTRSHMNAGCTSGSNDGGDMGDDSNDGGDMGDDSSDNNDDDKKNVTLSGEASLDSMEIDAAEDDSMEEGAEDSPVAQVYVEFTDGDAEISRVDVSFDSGDATDVWDVLETVSLWVDGDKVAEENADDEDDYLDEDTGTIRFTGLDLVGMEDDEVEIIVAATIQNNLDSDDVQSYTVAVDSMRFFDADGVATTEDAGYDFGDTVEFTIEEAGADDEVRVRTASNDPDGSTLQVEDDKNSDWYEVFVFDLDTDESVNDIEFDNIVVTLDVAGNSTTTVDGLLDDAELEIDGVTIDDYTVTGGNTNSATLNFDIDGDVVVDAGDRVSATLSLRFNALDGNDGNVEGATVAASVDSSDIDAEGVDNITDLTGAASGDTHTLRTQGIDVTNPDVEADKTSVDGANNDTVDYTIEVDVTAFEQDVYIDTNPATSVDYQLEDGSGNPVASGTALVNLSSTGSEVSGAFEITEGETETITLTVTYTPGTDVSARLQLESIDFGDTAGAPTGQTWTASPEEDYRTATVNVTD